LIVDRNNLDEFLDTKAEPWQRQSYLRARQLLRKDNISSRVKLGLTDEEIRSLKDIREKLIQPYSKIEDIHIKFSKGGLADTELCVQSLLLFHKIQTNNTRTDLQINDLLENNIGGQALIDLNQGYLRLRVIEQMLKLIQQSDTLKIPTVPRRKEKLAHILSLNSQDLDDHIQETLILNEKNIKALDPIWS
jgi:glutamine synthetase adenylyltransferase